MVRRSVSTLHSSSRQHASHLPGGFRWERKHKLGKLAKGSSQDVPTEPSGVEGGHTRAIDSFSSCSCSPSVAYVVDEAMSTSSRKSLFMEKERDWCSANFPGEMEKLEVEGSFSVAEGGSMDPERKADHWSVRTKTTKEEGEEVKGAEYEEQVMEVDVAVAGMQPSSKETDGGFLICEVEEQQPARVVEVQCPKRKVIREESEETQDHVRESQAISQEEAGEIGFCAKCFK